MPGNAALTPFAAKSRNVDVPNIQDLDINDVFELAKEEHLRGRPDVIEPDHLSARRKAAYVVFRGRKTGVFETWHVFFLCRLERIKILFYNRPAAAQQIHDLPGGKKGYLQGYYSYNAAVKAWEHALANNLVTVIDDLPSASPRLLRPAPASRSSRAPPRHRLFSAVSDEDDSHEDACAVHRAAPPSPPPSSTCRQVPASPKQPLYEEPHQATPKGRKPPSSGKHPKHRPPEPVADDEDMFLSDDDPSLEHRQRSASPNPAPPHGNSSTAHARSTIPPSASPRCRRKPPLSSTRATQLSQPSPSPSTPPTQSFQPSPSPSPSLRVRTGPSLTTLSAQTEISDEQCHWVVVRGAVPGVYKGR
ncbi:hypothetical protein C0992_007676 [Termitomyces sp. T32_za158]|nr:hypothetical protein C0992_007676 [Termitomyces sp. T32_za158]